MVKLNSVAFADDIFILSSADTLSIRIIKEVLDNFVELSVLKPNLYKSEVFVFGVSISKKHANSDLFGIPIGSLPIKYLGVPLRREKLSYLDCESLLDKVNNKINSWCAMKLFYGVQPIN